MKKLLIFTLLAFILAVSASGTKKLKNKEIIGEWKYEVSTAPQGYESGTLIFEVKEDKLTGKVKFADGYQVEFKNVKIENGVLKFALYVDAEYITGKAKIEGKKMRGTINTPDGEVPLTAEKIK